MSASAEVDAILRALRQSKREARATVFVSGNFNVVHPGHLRLLKFAAECGDCLIVGVNRDGARGTSIPEDMRLEGVRAISIVDHAFLLESSPESFITQLKPAFVVKGKEYEGRANPEQAAVDEYGGKLLFSSGEVRFSSLDLLHREYSEANMSAIVKPPEFPRRHGFDTAKLRLALEKMKGLQVMVVGDLIVDEYITCEPLGMSQEDPTIVVTPIESKRFVGGAGIVAAHAVGLGAHVNYFGVCGEDEVAYYARDALGSCGVGFDLIADRSRPTTLKQRFRASGKTLLRVSRLRGHDVPHDVADKILQRVRDAMPSTALLVFSDFNYGCLPQELVAEIARIAAEHDVMVVADSQASSQISDVSRFRNTALLTPTEREARLAMRDPSAGLVVLAEALGRKANARNVVVTLGEEGMLIVARDGAEYVTDRLPAMNTAPKDPAGAGDSFLTCASMALCAGVDIWQSAYLGSLAAACQVARLGNTPLTQQDLIAEIDLPT